MAGPILLRYDDNDIFHITVPAPTQADPAATSSSYVDAESFEALLATVIDPANLARVNGDTDLPGKRNGTLAWNGYDHDDEDERTLFTFVLTVVTS